MTGKAKCKMLKELRAKIAAENGIDGFEYKECPYQGPCDGTCPACDTEAEKLYNELKKLGKEPPSGSMIQDGAEEFLDVTMGIIEPIRLEGELTADYFDYKPEDDGILEGKQNQEPPSLVLGQMKCTSPQEPEKPIEHPHERLPGKVIDRQYIKRGKITKEAGKQQKIQDDTEKKPRGLLKLFKKDDDNK